IVATGAVSLQDVRQGTGDRLFTLPVSQKGKWRDDGYNAVISEEDEMLMALKQAIKPDKQ
ncbi:MAG: hypothetical protein CFH39_01489, partial [Alphaproteobacteria bacterium MarineAlpha10_Bin2]